jgi:tetratricopeptide (TPR) repeat protein
MEHIHNGEYDNALLAFSRVLHMQRERHGDVHPTVASAFHNLGTVHAKRAAVLMEGSAQQRHVQGQALACFQAAARTARDALGRNHPNVAVSLVRIGFLLLQSRQYQNAIVTFKEALRIRLSCYGGRHALTANLYNNLGVCHMHLAQFEGGREYLQAALDIQRDIAERSIAASAADAGGDITNNGKRTSSNGGGGSSSSSTDSWMNRLELADTLFNIGGLCLEWIRRQGPDARRAVDAEEAFAEALEVSR